MTFKDNDELRGAILKQGTVKKAKITFSQKMYSNNTVSPIEMSNQDIVEIGIDDLMRLISNREKLVRIDEGETIKATYGVWYNKLSKEHGVKQEIPHTAFHQIIEERITTLRKELDTQTQEEER